MRIKMYVHTKLVFGDGKLKEVRKEKMPGKKAMIVVSKGKRTGENGNIVRTQEK